MGPREGKRAVYSVPPLSHSFVGRLSYLHLNQLGDCSSKEAASCARMGNECVRRGVMAKPLHEQNEEMVRVFEHWVRVDGKHVLKRRWWVDAAGNEHDITPPVLAA